MVEYRSYSKPTIIPCVNFLQKVNWHLILDPYDVDTAFDIFLRTLLLAVDNCVPKKTKNIHKQNEKTDGSIMN